MQLPARPPLLLTTFAALAAFGCKSDGSSNAPGALEQAADDISYEADHAGETVEQIGDDMRGAAEEVADSVRGTSDDGPDTNSPDPDEVSEPGKTAEAEAAPDSE